MMPMFSPDGRLLAFNDFAEGGGRGLAIMDFDLAARTATTRRVAFTDATQYPGWPFFLPDNRALVFARGDNPQFSGAGAGVFPGTGFLAPASDLYIVDIASSTSTLLAQAMGLSTPQDTTGYVPFGADDLHKHYYPTVSPVAAGGYFWIFFDSIRNYGNQGVSRQLWGSALTIAADGAYATDPSHPAFYVTGQDFLTGNHRAFTALDACKKDGDKCTSGTDCCGGFCFVEPSVDQEFGNEPVGSCSSDIPKCAKTNERCTSSADCCPPAAGEPANKCIAGFCAYVPPVE
jgi:WD40-like Beta Propeller Repeat